MAADHREQGALARGSVQLLMGRMFFLLAGFVIAAILSRVLGPAVFGLYGVIISILTWFERALHAGVPGAAALHIPKLGARSGLVEQAARILLGLWSIPLFITMWWAAPDIAEYFSIPHGTHLLRIVALNLPLMSLFFASEGILNGRRNFRAHSGLQVLHSGTKLLGVLALLVFGITLERVFTAHVAATMVTVVVLLAFLPPTRALPPQELVSSMLRFALPGSVYAIALPALLNMSLWQLKASETGGAEAVLGYFVAALNLTRILHVVPAAVSTVLFSSLSWANAHEDRALAQRHIRDASRLSLMVLTPGWVLLAVDAPSVMALLFGEAYRPGGTIMIILTLAFAFSALTDVWLIAMSAGGRVKVSAAMAVGLLPVMFCANLLLIPLAGARGAASASALVFAFGALVAGTLVARKYGALIRPLAALRILGAGAAVWVVGLLLPPAGAWVLLKLPLLGLLYLAILWMSKEISRQDLAALPMFAPKRP